MTMKNILGVSALALLTTVAACKKQDASTTVSSAVSTETQNIEQQASNSVATDAVTTISSALDTQGSFNRIVERVTPLFQSQALGGGENNLQKAAQLLEEFKGKYQDVATYQNTLLQQNFSEQELASISQFLSTDTGKKFMANSSKIQTQTEEYALQQSNDIMTRNAVATNGQDAALPTTTYGSIKNAIGNAADEAKQKANEAATSVKDAAKSLQEQLENGASEAAKPAELQPATQK